MASPRAERLMGTRKIAQRGAERPTAAPHLPQLPAILWPRAAKMTPPRAEGLTGAPHGAHRWR
ncbi:MAG: hypothetical protein Tsb0020_00030 [Haliangiales bacterium]